MNSGPRDSWTTKVCRECGQALNRAIYYEGSPSNIKGYLVWCANPSCARIGVMLDPDTLEPKLIP
jgi:hypothetical protein